jgi:serine palmitoyltransferase
LTVSPQEKTMPAATVSQHTFKKAPPGHAEITDPEPHITWFAAFTTYLGYAVLIFLGRLRDLVGVWVGELAAPAKPPKGMAPLIFASENFYTRRLYYRVQEAFNRPILGAPGASINVVLRERRPTDCLMHVKPLNKDGTLQVRRCLNLGSYNYLGFGDDWKGTCGPDVLKALSKWPIGVSLLGFAR